jgi:hypothetical protein
VIVRSHLVGMQIVAALTVNAILSAAPLNKPDLSDIVLAQGQGGTLQLQALVREHRFTAVVFFSATCPCFAAHRGRLAALVHELESRDVRFVIVDSERRPAGAPSANSVPDSDLAIFHDEDGKLARRLEAGYATETFVFDTTGSLRYRGGIDDDRKHINPTAHAYLRDEVFGLLAGTAPPYTATKSLGCALRLK